jgi:hypothetical protein
MSSQNPGNSITKNPKGKPIKKNVNKKRGKRGKKEKGNNLTFEAVKNSYVKNCKRINSTYKDESDSIQKRIKNELLTAEKLWFDVNITIIENQDIYSNMSTKEQINLFKDNGYKEFCDEHTIISRYMICTGRYNMRAFERYLKKSIRFKPDAKQRLENRNYMRDQWVQRQADYARFLWEEEQPNTHFDLKQAKLVWSDAYTKFTKEFNNIDNMYQNAEEQVKVEDKQFKSELLKEIIEIDKNQFNKLSEDEQKYVLDKVLRIIHRKSMRNVVNEIKDVTKRIPSYMVGSGKNREAQYQYDYEKRNRNFIKSIEKEAKNEDDSE